MNRWEKLLQPTPYPGAPAVPWPVGQPAPVLPTGKAGISVRVRCRATDSTHTVSPKAIGVDDQPMWHGLGRMIVVTEPGEHLVEVRGRSSAETARLVRVHAGQMAELEYWVPASFGSVDGVLVPAPAQRRPGSGYWAALAAVLAMTGVMVAATASGDRLSRPLTVIFGAALFIVPLAVMVLWSRVKRGIDRRYRTAVSYEASGDVRAADTGMFLGDGAAPASAADDHHGVLVVTGTTTREYVRNGLQVGTVPTDDPNAWLPWPSLTIDGAQRPFSWRSWCYRLPAGEHTVTVAVQPPLGQERVRAGSEPVTTTVQVAANRVTRLDVRVKATVAVVATDRIGPTKLNRFEATVDVRAAAPAAPGT